MLWDTHMHCHFSGDSDATPESMILSAKQKDLAGICFTDHLDYDYPNDPNEFLLDIPAYKSSILKLKEGNSSNFSILWGIELGLQPQLVERNNFVTKTNDFDFVIGSSHVVHNVDPYYPEYYENRSEKDAYLEYFSSILENIKLGFDFDVYGHLDYVVRYGPTKNDNYYYKDYSDIIDDILKELISQGKGIELNTGGFKYGLGHPNPCEDILKRYKELGGEIITIGADAHKPEHVAFDFHKVPDLLESVGFSYATVFKNRKPEFYKIK